MNTVDSRLDNDRNCECRNKKLWKCENKDWLDERTRERSMLEQSGFSKLPSSETEELKDYFVYEVVEAFRQVVVIEQNPEGFSDLQFNLATGLLNERENIMRAIEASTHNLS